MAKKAAKVVKTEDSSKVEDEDKVEVEEKVEEKAPVKGLTTTDSFFNEEEGDGNAAPIDYTKEETVTSKKEEDEIAEKAKEELKNVPVVVDTSEVVSKETVRIQKSVTSMVYGGTYYDFNKGQRYTISKELAKHLRDREIAFPNN